MWIAFLVNLTAYPFTGNLLPYIARNIHHTDQTGVGYMSASLPILGSINPGNDLSEMLEDHEAGLCSLNGDDDRLYAHALQLAQDASYRRRLGQNARRLLERYFSVAVCANQILARFQTAPVFAYQSSSEPRAVARPALRKTN